MNSVQIVDSFGIDNLKLQQIEQPTTGPRDVLVKIVASSINYRDLMMVSGSYNPKQPLPLIPCSDGVGVVEQVGEQVDRFKVGDRVCSVFSPNWIAGKPNYRDLKSTLGGPLPGMLAEYVSMDQDAWVAAPKNLSDIEAATLTCAGVTAWSALIDQGDLQPGETVLLQGTGGVSLFALLFAKAAGAHVIITSSSDEKLAIAKKLGADETINYKKQPEWGKVARDMTGRNGVDHIVEVGGAKTMAQSLKAIAVGGNIAVIGVLTGVKQEISFIPLLMQNVRMQGIFVGNRKSFVAMNRTIELLDLHPHIDSTFPFAQSADAFRYLKSAKHVGKIVIETNK